MGININFDNWTIRPGADTLAYQRDHKSRVLLVTGNLPAGWDWAMLVSCNGHDNTVLLLPMEGGIGAELTRDDLPFGNCQYEMQLKGAQGEAERHTNKIQIYIPASLSGAGTWPEVPSEFAQAEARMRELLAQGQTAESNAAASAGCAEQSAGQAAEDRAAAENAALSAQAAARDAAAAQSQAQKAEQAAAQHQQAAETARDAAQTAANSMAYVTFATDAEGHVLIRNGDLLGPTAFCLTPAGHLEVDY